MPERVVAGKMVKALGRRGFNTEVSATEAVTFTTSLRLRAFA